MIERAGPSDREAFAAALNADALGFEGGDDGDVAVGEAAYGPPPTIAIRRRREDPTRSILVVVTIDPGQTGWLACSVVATEYAADGKPTASRTLLTPIMKSSTGEFLVETHVGRLVGAGEYTQYFWTLAGAQLGG